MIEREEATLLARAGQRIGEGERRAVVEQDTLMTLLGNEAVHQAQQDYIDLGGDEQEESMMHKHVVFQCLSQYPPAVRLRRMLLRPDTVNEGSPTPSASGMQNERSTWTVKNSEGCPDGTTSWLT